MSKGKPKSYKRFAKKLPEEIKRRKRAQKYKSRVAERQQKKEKRKIEEEKVKAQTAAADREFEEKANKDETEALKMVSGRSTFEGLVSDVPLDTPIENVSEEHPDEEITFSADEIAEISSFLKDLSADPEEPVECDDPTQEEMTKSSENTFQKRKINEYFALKSQAASSNVTKCLSNASTIYIDASSLSLIGEHASTSMAALRLFVALFRYACDYDTESTSLSLCGHSFDFPGADAIEFTLAYGLGRLGSLFEGHLGIPAKLEGEERHNRVVQLLRSRSKVWNAGIALLSRVFLRASVRMLAKAGSVALRTRLVNELFAYVPFFAQFPLIANLYADVLAQYIAEATEVDEAEGANGEELADKASNTILAIAQDCIVASTFAGDAIRIVYRHCIKASNEAHTSSLRQRDVNATAIARDCITKLFGLNYTVAYKVSFPYIRMLTLYIRGAVLRNDESDSGNLIRSWPVIDAACLWGTVLAVHAPISDHLKNFIFPVVQILFNIIDFCPEAAHMSIRLLCVDVINELSFKTQTFSNTLPALLQCLEHKELKTDLPSDEREFEDAEFNPTLRISKTKLGSRKVQKELFDHIYAGMLEFLAHYSRSIAFPEIAVPALVALRKFKLECMNLFFCKRVGYLIGKIKANHDWVVSRRNKVEFTPKDIDAAKDFLKDDKGKSPLSLEWKKFSRKFESMFGSLGGVDEDDEDDDKKMNGGKMIEQNIESDEEDDDEDEEEDEDEIEEGFEDEFDEENEDEEDDEMIMNDEFDEADLEGLEEEEDEDEEEEEEEVVVKPPKKKKSKRN